MNTLIKLIKAFPDEEWSAFGLSQNPNITLDYVLEHENIVWDWKLLAQNEGITLENIENEPKLQIWKYVAMNPNITLEFILKHIYRFCSTYNSQFLGGTQHITLDMIEQYPNLFWNKKIISSNPNLTFKFIENHPSDDINKWDMCSILKNPICTTPDALINVKEFKKRLIGYGAQFGEYFVNGYPLHYFFALNPNITPDIIMRYGDWQWSWIAQNPVISLDELRKYNKYHNSLTRTDLRSWSPNLTTEYVIDNPQIKWDFFALSQNPFDKHPELMNQIIIRV